MGSKKRFKSFDSGHGRLKLTPDRDDNQQYINWFPGHMNKAMRQIKAKLKLVDIVLEIRDARLPSICSNSALKETLGNKLKLIIFNKANLADPTENSKWSKFLDENEVNHLFVNGLEKEECKKILERVREMVSKAQEGSEKKKLSMMLLGLPNTGKSTLINRLSMRAAARTANKPGHTQTQQWIKIDEFTQLLDTPGIMPPKIENYEDGLKLCAIYAIPSKIVADETTACFLMRYLLENNRAPLKELYGIDEDVNEFQQALTQVGLRRNVLIKKGEVDYERVYKILLSDFREGKLGRISLEKAPS